MIRVGRALGVPVFLVSSWVLSSVVPVVAQTNNLCDHPGEAPDMIVGDISDIQRWGNVSGISGFSLGTITCNIGTCWLGFNGSAPNHPVVAQNMYRLKKGRFEQIGQSWIKHFGGALQQDYCGSCLPAPDGTRLGVLCSDTYNAATNGTLFFFGLRSGINPHTGEDPYPYRVGPTTGNAIFKRLQVKDSEIDPALNPGAHYWVEVHVVGMDDVIAGVTANNWSYRSVDVVRSGNILNLVPTAPTAVGPPTISVWSQIDPSVRVTQATMPDDGTFQISVKVAWVGNGTWSYEYAVENLDAHAAPLAFEIPVPPGVQITGTGFHDVAYHSGDSQDNTNWSRAVGATSVIWKANTLLLEGQTPNVLQWGTIYNFRFFADAPPGTHLARMGFSMPPGGPFDDSFSIATLTPSLCDGDGICDPGESCASCPADCEEQGGGSGCCGNGACDAGESATSCFADCGPTQGTETNCGDGLDGDRDGLLDCSDPDCCGSPTCALFDDDEDARVLACDCNDADKDLWATPSEVPGLLITKSALRGADLAWSFPAERGATAPDFDAIRSTDVHDFLTSGVCLPSAAPKAPGTSDAEDPAPGSAFYYLVRARDACAAGTGPLGSSSSGQPHTAPACQ